MDLKFPVVPENSAQYKDMPLNYRLKDGDDGEPQSEPDQQPTRGTDIEIIHISGSSVDGAAEHDYIHFVTLVFGAGQGRLWVFTSTNSSGSSAEGQGKWRMRPARPPNMNSAS